MRTPGLGENRLSSTSGVWPIAWTMSPYLPPHGRLSRRGSIIASKSVVPRLDPPYPYFRQSMLACAGEHQVEILAPRRHLERLLLDHLVGHRRDARAVQANRYAPAAVGIAGGLLGVEVAGPEGQLPEHSPYGFPGCVDDVRRARLPADRAPQERDPMVGQLARPERAMVGSPCCELRARHVRPVCEVESSHPP